MNTAISQNAAAGADLLSSAIRACQEYEGWHADWLAFASSQEEENKRLTAELEAVEGRKKQIQEIREKQERMVEAQMDLINTLKRDIADMEAEPLSPGEFLAVDPALRVDGLDSRPCSPSPSEGQAAALLLEHVGACR
ncbi:hypothetical protein IF1G_11034 [Cordyceps javanica]|uniref:Uncharacterized protein n=1 Tax=Cordyceps javanica TaxID=43265 RepID=A0A545VJ26_9HYPO|nr:hypothetical protein IF1G_11034 [Cordyceps javanica]TQW01734.1 bacterial type III secretion protein (HrpB7) domain-containing protein [Cordyceps javanica]